MNKQKGYINFTGWDLAVACGLVAIIGWGIIESIVWVFSHIEFSWV